MGVNRKAMFENIANVRIAIRQKSGDAAEPGCALLQAMALPRTRNPETPLAPPAKDPVGAGSRMLARNNTHAAQRSERRDRSNVPAAMIDSFRCPWVSKHSNVLNTVTAMQRFTAVDL